ncbi:hypothetical protein D6T64_08750 [Cryobacterium melibiosiphilum]|uniref:Uncharacterized protein n=1 Tax=Cryobacterium melibiosiphilum TaxID=995039 RepID=A0A3A5MPI1_9MICO|nr:hypothetical protein [Cryobacterium melibiosiphilum]RJT88863.1 hypothetical protein D6T64_08750 [Cryobacterium melibiosiphilum]
MEQDFQDWIEHRRGRDRELLGWLRPAGDGFVVVDLLGRDRSEVVDWLTGEEALESLGIGYLADPYELRLDSGQWLRVRITEVSAHTISVKRDDWGAIDIPQLNFTVSFPAIDELRALA